jgi:hypothetical protein
MDVNDKGFVTFFDCRPASLLSGRRTMSASEKHSFIYPRTFSLFFKQPAVYGTTIQSRQQLQLFFEKIFA